MYKNMVRMEDELAERVKARAKEEKRSMNNMLCHALEVYLKEGGMYADKTKAVVHKRPN